MKIGFSCLGLLLFTWRRVLINLRGYVWMKVEGLEERREIEKGRRTQTGAIRGSPYRRCDGLCVCISVQCIARQDSAIRRCAVSANTSVSLNAIRLCVIAWKRRSFEKRIAIRKDNLRIATRLSQLYEFFITFILLWFHTIILWFYI